MASMVSLVSFSAAQMSDAQSRINTCRLVPNE